MARRRRLLLRLLVLVVGFAAVAAAAAPLVPLSALKPGVELRLSEMLGRKVTVDSLRFGLIHGPHLTISGMTASEDPAFGEDVFLKADEVRADIDVVQYLRGRRIAINAIAIKSPQIQFVKSADGAWSWTTIGRRPATQSMRARLSQPAILSLLFGYVSSTDLKSITIENASVSLLDRTNSRSDTLYSDIALRVLLAPAPEGGSEAGTTAKGEFVAQSEGEGQAGLLKASLPFDLRIDRGGAGLSVAGSIGPGPLETRNLTIGSFAINGQLRSETSAPLTSQGQMSLAEVFIRTINLSAQVAHALRVNEIGDMNPGTAIASLETGFQVSRGTVSTTGLRAEQVDGLGDARADKGAFKIESALTVDYAWTVRLSADATSRVKMASPMLGLLATILETDNRLSVPINIKGDLQNPQIQVDVSRVF